MVHRMCRTARSAIFLAVLLCPLVTAKAEFRRLYDGVTAFVNNPDGVDFVLALTVKDINYQSRAPSELLVKVYPPDGRPVVRQLIADDGVESAAYAPPVAGWDHEAFYYATSRSRGLEPMMSWSVFSGKERLQTIPAREFQYPITAGQKGIYRIVLMGNPDLYVDLSASSSLAMGFAGNPEWLHGHGDLYRRSHIFVPEGADSVHALFLQLDRPACRSFTVSDLDGNVLISGNGASGLARTSYEAPSRGALDRKVLVVDVTDGPGDFLLNVSVRMWSDKPSGRSTSDVTLDNFDSLEPWRGRQFVTAVMAPSEAAATAMAGGSIKHDGKLFWQMYQVRLYDYLKTLESADFEYPDDLPQVADYHSVGSHERPVKGVPGWGDRVMHDYAAHKHPGALNFALRDMFFGMRVIGPGDHVTIGPLSNLAYEMGCYSHFFPRPAWRILRQTEAPEEAKGPIREYVTQICDRLAMVRGIELVNGNSLASLLESLRYCVEATDDEMNERMYRTFLDRFRSGGFGERIGISASGGLQESFGYDFHYGSYVLRGWNAVRADLHDPDFEEMYAGIMTLYSYMWSPVGSAPWNARTGLPKLAGGTYDPWHADARFRWKGYGGVDLTDNVNGGGEWFAARRSNYYFLTYHGRLSPIWMGEGFHGQQGYGGGAICQLYVPGNGNGPVLGSSLNGSYGKGMHVSQWHGFHIHSIVGETTDGQPLVTANSEHRNAALDGMTLTSSGEVRQSSVSVIRKYEYEPTSILCSASLAPAAADSLFSIWGGRPTMRGKVSEAYEMIPYIDVAPNKKTGKRGPGATQVTFVGPDGEDAALLTDAGAMATAVIIDRDGYGVRIQLEKEMRVLLGQNDTVLIELAKGHVPAEEVSISYRLVPYVGDPPTSAEGTTTAHPLARLTQVPAAAEVGSALAAVEGMTVKSRANGAAGVVKFAVAGESLILLADVQETKMSRGAAAWNGSCVEVFGAMPGREEIGQLFLLPAIGDKPAVALSAQAGGPSEADEVSLSSELTETGYVLSGIIPLRLLKLDPKASRVRLECQITHAGSGPGSSKGLRHTALFGSVGAYEHSERYGMFVIQ